MISKHTRIRKNSLKIWEIIFVFTVSIKPYTKFKHFSTRRCKLLLNFLTKFRYFAKWNSFDERNFQQTTLSVGQFLSLTLPLDL